MIRFPIFFPVLCASSVLLAACGGGSLNLPSTRMQITDITAALCK